MKKEQMKNMERNVHANTGEATCINVYPSMHSSDHTAQKKNHIYVYMSYVSLQCGSKRSARYSYYSKNGKKCIQVVFIHCTLL